MNPPVVKKKKRNQQGYGGRGVAVLWVHSYGQLKSTKDFPGGPMGKDPPSNAGDADSIPGRGGGGVGGKIPHAQGQLNPSTSTTEPKCPRIHTQQLEKPLSHNKDPAQPTTIKKRVQRIWS